MNTFEIVMKYMNILFSGENLDRLLPLLSENFTFKGPLYKFENPNEYVTAMKKDPPQGFQYNILNVVENDSTVCLIYEFRKEVPKINTTMAQLFQIENKKIVSILLLFDTAPFTS